MELLEQILFIIVIILIASFIFCTIPQNNYSSFGICRLIKKIFRFRFDDLCEPEELNDPVENFRPFYYYCDGEDMGKLHTYDKNIYQKTLFPSDIVF
jgi:hypothetical protein